MPDAPDVFYLHCHDAGRFLGPYHPWVPTPHLNAFAAQATVFNQAFCAAPTCSPSRAALLTGQTAHQAGMLGLAHRGFSLQNDSQHLVPYLQSFGYETALSGIQHEWDLRNGPSAVRYQHILPRARPWVAGDPALDRAVGQAAATFVRQRDSSKPLFLSCGFFYPHREFPVADPALVPTARLDACPVPPSASAREDMAAYMTAARCMDDGFAELWQALQQPSKGRERLIIFTTDHGIAFPKMKCNLTGSGTGVALIVQAPDGQRPGQSVDAMVSHLDLFATICDYAGVPLPEWNQGRSLRPLLVGEAVTHRQEIFAEVTYHAGYEPKRSVRTVDFNYIRNFELPFHPALANIDRSPTKTWMKEHQLLNHPPPAEELYDLRVDPLETSNVAPQRQYQDVLQSMRQRLDDWMQQTRDPLRHGHVDPPPAAIVNAPDSPEPDMV